MNVLMLARGGLKTTVRMQFDRSLLQVMMRHVPRTSFLAFVKKGEMVLIRLDEEKLKAHVQRIGYARRICTRKRWVGKRRPRGVNAGFGQVEITDFAVRDFLQVARKRKPGRIVNLVSEWTGTWSVVSHDSVHMAEHIMSGETCDAHIALTCFYTDSKIYTTRR